MHALQDSDGTKQDQPEHGFLITAMSGSSVLPYRQNVLPAWSSYTFKSPEEAFEELDTLRPTLITNLLGEMRGATLGVTRVEIWPGGEPKRTVFEQNDVIEPPQQTKRHTPRAGAAA